MSDEHVRTQMDESIHGVFVGLLAQEVKQKFPQDKQRELEEWTLSYLLELMENEEDYTDLIYSQVDLDVEVKKFLKYNANKALMNLGLEPYYDGIEINPIVENGLDTDTKTHDFFSTKGNGYVKSKQEEITDDIFDF